MDPQEGVPETRKTSGLDRLQAAVEVLLVSGLFSSFFAALPFSLARPDSDVYRHGAKTLVAFLVLEATITLVLILAVLRSHGESTAELGLRLRRFSAHAAAGLLLVPLLFLANVVVALLLRQFLPDFVLDRNPLMDTIRTTGDLVLFNAAALYAGGLKEEIQRAFVLSRFSRHLGGAAPGLVIWSIAFGAGHYLQGVQGVIAATLFGFLFGAIYLARRSLVAPIVAHAVYDTVALWAFWLARPSVP